MAPFSELSLSMGEASVGAEGGFGHRGLLGPRGLSLVPLALLCLVFGAGGLQQPQGEVQEEEMKILESKLKCQKSLSLSCSNIYVTIESCFLEAFVFGKPYDKVCQLPFNQLDFNWILIPQSSSPEKDEVGFDGFEGVNEVGDYDEYEDEYVTEGEEVEEDYEVDYEYVDLQKDSDGDGLR